MDWMQVLANLINGVLVIIVVQFLKNYGMSWLKANAPWALPVLALVAGMALNAAAAALGGLLGYPIDFSPIVGVLTGAGAVVVYDVAHKAGG